MAMNTSLKKSAFAFFQIFRLLQLTLSNANELLDIVPSFSPLGTYLVACTQTLFYFSFRSFGKHRQARERGEHALAVNKSAAVYFLSRVLDGLSRE